ncbi:MAG: hypothetical protein QM755_15050 [Luteolibacter sp.]
MTRSTQNGILRALRLAGERALGQLPESLDHVLLDGSYDWLTRPAPTLSTSPTTGRQSAGHDPGRGRPCGVPASPPRASLAKSTRDAIVVERAQDHPAYGWAVNKGYASPEDAAPPSSSTVPADLHRPSWNLLHPEEGDLTDPVG